MYHVSSRCGPPAVMAAARQSCTPPRVSGPARYPIAIRYPSSARTLGHFHSPSARPRLSRVRCHAKRGHYLYPHADLSIYFGPESTHGFPRTGRVTIFGGGARRDLPTPWGGQVGDVVPGFRMATHLERDLLPAGRSSSGERSAQGGKHAAKSASWPQTLHPPPPRVRAQAGRCPKHLRRIEKPKP